MAMEGSAGLEDFCYPSESFEDVFQVLQIRWQEDSTQADDGSKEDKSGKE